MTQVGAGKYTYELQPHQAKLPPGQAFGLVSRVAVDSQDRLYVFQRKNPPVLVFDSDGNYLSCWGIDAIKEPHGFRIVNDIVYITDRDDSVAAIYTLDGKPLKIIGKRGVHSDTGCEKPGTLVPRAAGPFNYPTELMPGPSGNLYVTDGYRNARVHKFTADGQLIKSWGEPGKDKPGHFHLPHSIAISPDEKLYICDRGNGRIQIFTADGEFIGMWTGLGGPNDIYRDKDDVFYIADQKTPGGHPTVSVRDNKGSVIAQWEARHPHGLTVNSRGDIYLALSGLGNHADRGVDKYVRKH